MADGWRILKRTKYFGKSGSPPWTQRGEAATKLNFSG
jgi:hypothetical protein